MTGSSDTIGTPDGDDSAALTLSFSRALLELTVRENGVAMDTIARSFSEFARLFVDVEQRCNALRTAMPDNAQLVSVSEDCAEAALALSHGLRAMQLHDITDQRLSHVATLLAAVSRGQPLDIESVLTDDEERALLRLIEDGVPTHEASARLGEDGSGRGSVELF